MIANFNSISFLVIITIIFIFYTFGSSFGIIYLIVIYTISLVIIFIIGYINDNKVYRNKIILIMIFNTIYFLFLSFEVFTKNDKIQICNEKEFRIKFLPLNQFGKKEDSFRCVGIIKELVPLNQKWISKKAVIRKASIRKTLPPCSEIEIMANLESSAKTDELFLTNVRVITNNQRNSKQTIHLLERRFRDKLISSNSAAFGWAMLTGSKAFIDPKVYEIFQKTGTLHLFAVSGLHFGFLYIILCIIFYPLKDQPLVSLTTKLAICMLYLTALGMPFSGLRAFMMIFFYEVMLLFNIRNRSIITLCLSCIFIVILFKEYLFSLSSQLSFTVVLFIIFILHDNKYINNKGLNIFYRIPFWFFISIAASCGSTFLVLDHFGYFPFLGIFVNTIISPVVFIFYLFNMLFFIFYFVFNTDNFSVFLDFFYNIIYVFVDYFSYLSDFLPGQESLNIEINNFFHLLIFSFVLLSFCFKIKVKLRIYFILIFFSSAWLSVFVSSLHR